MKVHPGLEVLWALGWASIPAVVDIFLLFLPFGSLQRGDGRVIGLFFWPGVDFESGMD